MFRFRCFGFLPFRLSAKTLWSAKAASFTRNKLFLQHIFGQKVSQSKVYRPKEAVSVSTEISAFSKGLVSVTVFRPKTVSFAHYGQGDAVSEGGTEWSHAERNKITSDMRLAFIVSYTTVLHATIATRLSGHC